MIITDHMHSESATIWKHIELKYIWKKKIKQRKKKINKFMHAHK